MRVTRLWVVGMVISGGLVFALAQGHSPAQSPATTTKVRIGTYNTRAVALAYGRSEAVLSEIGKKTKEGQAAKDKDAKRYAQIKTEMEEMQALRHAQVFADAPIGDIMATMKDVLPDIAQKAGVTAIVPQVNYQDPAIEVVDVTDALVAHYKPDEKTLKFIKDLKSKPPVSYKVLMEHKE
jgi:hypothetical protein